MTVAPWRFAICTAIVPTAPEAPKISTVDPRRRCSRSMPCMAVRPVVTTAAASRVASPAGMRST
jgi:hypothetical protein